MEATFIIALGKCCMQVFFAPSLHVWMYIFLKMLYPDQYVSRPDIYQHLHVWRHINAKDMCQNDLCQRVLTLLFFLL